MLFRLTALLILLIPSAILFAQDSSLTGMQFSGKYLGQVASKANSLEAKLFKKSEKMLRQLKRQESRIVKKLSKVDSLAAKSLSRSMERYELLKRKLQSPGKLTNYLPKLDTLATSLKFINANPQLLSPIADGREKLEKAIAGIKQFEDQLQKAEDIKRFIKERKQFLKEQLSRFGFTRELKKLNKRAYYYGQQINEYRDLLKERKKAEKKVLELLSQSKLFRDFMKKNSMLASFFSMPGGRTGASGPQGGFAALQTRTQLTSFLQQNGLNNPGTRQQFGQNIQGAQSELNQLRNRLGRAGAKDGDLNMPAFRPNQQKTKSFFRRLEYGTNVQSQKASTFFPITSDIGLSVGYKLNDRSIIGIGASYKIGWGKGWNNIRLTNQGVGLRSFADWKIKGAFWFSAGYEQNYRTVFNSIEQLKDLSAWQQSGLVGMSKTVSLKSKFFKKAKLQLLWDFLSYQQKPRTQPVLFRVGYNF